MIPKKSSLLCGGNWHTHAVKSIIRFTLVVLFLVTTLFPARAAFSSLYVFGDTLSTTTDPDTTGLPYYYSGRDSNGRVWVEVLAQRQGLNYDATKNNSYWDHNSSNLVAELKSFNAPPDVASALFIVWVCNADTFDAAQVPDTLAQWQAANKSAQANHFQIIAQLYAKGVRNLVLPNAVDISQIPAFNGGTKYTATERAGCLDYNLKFSSTISQARVMYPDLHIYAPDYFTLLNNVLTNAAYYGLTNALSSFGFSIDALTSLYAKTPGTLNGPGTNYIFWDAQDPTAKFHAIIADVAQQIISPVQIGQLTVLNGSNRLDLVNVPVGLNGFVEGITTTNQTPSVWTTVQGFSSTNTTQSFFVTAPQFQPFLIDTNSSGGGSIDPGGPPGTNAVSHVVQPSQAQIYRLRFPYAWNWP